MVLEILFTILATRHQLHSVVHIVCQRWLILDLIQRCLIASNTLISLVLQDTVEVVILHNILSIQTKSLEAVNTLSKTGISTMQAIITWIIILFGWVRNINFDLSNHTDILWAFSSILLAKLRLWVKTILTHKWISISNIVVFLGDYATNWLEGLRKHFILGNVSITDHSNCTL